MDIPEGLAAGGWPTGMEDRGKYSEGKKGVIRIRK